MRWRGRPDDGFEALEREGEVRAAFGGDEGVDLIDDDGIDGAQGGGRLGGEQQVERFRGGDENVGGMAAEASALDLRACRRCGWRSRGDGRGRRCVAGEGGDGFERRAEVAFDVDSERFEGADVDDAAAGGVWDRVEGMRRSRHQRKAVRVLPVPVGARMRVLSPRAMAGQPRRWGVVGVPSAARNHSRVTGWKRASGSEMGGDSEVFFFAAIPVERIIRANQVALRSGWVCTRRFWASAWFASGSPCGAAR